MPTGRPDYWFGLALYFENDPADGEFSRGPTSNWAFDHAADAEAHQGLADMWKDRGDIGAVDKEVGDFTQDGNWHDWDISALVGSKAVLVGVRVVMTGPDAGEVFLLQRNGGTAGYNVDQLYLPVANLGIAATLFVQTDAAGVIEYKAGALLGRLSTLNATVCGWMEEQS
jgi:hypothetical protein